MILNHSTLLNIIKVYFPNAMTVRDFLHSTKNIPEGLRSRLISNTQYDDVVVCYEPMPNTFDTMLPYADGKNFLNLSSIVKDMVENVDCCLVAGLYKNNDLTLHFEKTKDLTSKKQYVLSKYSLYKAGLSFILDIKEQVFEMRYTQKITANHIENKLESYRIEWLGLSNPAKMFKIYKNQWVSSFYEGEKLVLNIAGYKEETQEWILREHTTNYQIKENGIMFVAKLTPYFDYSIYFEGAYKYEMNCWIHSFRTLDKDNNVGEEVKIPPISISYHLF